MCLYDWVGRCKREKAQKPNHSECLESELNADSASYDASIEYDQISADSEVLNNVDISEQSANEQSTSCTKVGFFTFLEQHPLNKTHGT